MRAEGRYGLVLVVPKDEAQRAQLGAVLGSVMLSTESGGLRGRMSPLPRSLEIQWLLTLTEFVVVCVPEDAAGTHSGPSALLLSPEGQVEAADRLTLDGPDGLVQQIRELCSREPSFSERAARVDAEALAELEGHIESGELFELDMEAKDWVDDWWATADRVNELILECAPALAVRLLEEGDSLYPLMYEVFRQPKFQGVGELASLSAEKGPPPAVHGVMWSYEHYDACPGCGMFSYPAEKRVFDHFLDE